MEIERVPAGPFLLSTFSDVQISFRQVFMIHGTRHSTQRYLQQEGKMELIEVITDYRDAFLDMTSEYVGRGKKE